MNEKYEVVHSFKDLEDSGYIYSVNNPDKNIYPREGLKPNKKRITELTSTKNKIGKVLIKRIETGNEHENIETEE